MKENLSPDIVLRADGAARDIGYTRTVQRRMEDRHRILLPLSRRWRAHHRRHHMGITGAHDRIRKRHPEVRAVYDDIMRTRATDWINNFGKVLARSSHFRRTWQSVKEIMAPALDAATRR
jgi:hypothetical protein